MTHSIFPRIDSFPSKLRQLGYTEEELDRDNPYTQYITNGENMTDEVKMATVQAEDGKLAPSMFDSYKSLIDEVFATELKNPLVIYHGKCADGFGAAWVFWKVQDLIQQGFDFHAGVYQKPPPDVTGRHVYIVDFSYKRAVIEQMLETAKSITIIDHHISAVADLKDLEHGKFNKILDIEHSGTVLAWNFWRDTFEEAGIPKPLLLGHIEDRDLWRFKLARTEEIQANLFSFDYDFAVWDKLMSMDEYSLMSFSIAGAAITRKHHKDIKELLDVCQRMGTIGFYYVPIANLPYTFTSDAGHLMAKGWQNGTMFAACYWDTPDTRVFSLRSTENGLDVSRIAVAYGGGGHKHAAGFSVPRDHDLARI